MHRLIFLSLFVIVSLSQLPISTGASSRSTATAALNTTALMEFAVSAQFDLFKQQYHRLYDSVTEEAAGLKGFQETLRRILEQRARNPHAFFGINKFADLTEEAFRRHYLRATPPAEEVPATTTPLSHGRAAATATPHTAADLSLDATRYAPARDWRQEGMVSAVKDQGFCGACWAFATTGVIESAWARAGHPLVELSEQQLVSCDTGNDGCMGGWMAEAVQWLLHARQGQILTAASYPYESGRSPRPVPCAEPTGDAAVIGATVAGPLRLAADEELMTAWIDRSGPLAIAVDATDFKAYMGGVMTQCESKRVNHAMLLVGYNNSATPPYWIIKNSWGTDWGEGGYMRLYKGNNSCLVSEYVLGVRVADPTDPPVPTTTAAPHLQLHKRHYAGFLCHRSQRIDVYNTNECVEVPDGVDGGEGRGALSWQVHCGRRNAVWMRYNAPHCTGEPTVEVMPLGRCVRGLWHSTSYTCEPHKEERAPRE